MFYFSQTKIPWSETYLPWNNADLSMQPFSRLACSQRSGWLTTSHSAMMSLMGSFDFELGLCSFKIFAFKTSIWIVPFLIWLRKQIITLRYENFFIQQLLRLNSPLQVFHIRMPENKMHLGLVSLYDPKIVVHQTQSDFLVLYIRSLSSYPNGQVNWRALMHFFLVFYPVNSF